MLTYWFCDWDQVLFNRVHIMAIESDVMSMQLLNYFECNV